MLFQDLVGTIIGSSISTAFAILVWVIIKITDDFLAKRKEKKKFSKLYTLFAKTRLEPFLSIDIANLIDDIGIKKFSKVLRLWQRTDPNGYLFSNQRLRIHIIFVRGANKIRIYDHGNIEFDYQKANVNFMIKEDFLKFFEAQCAMNKIRLKKELV